MQYLQVKINNYKREIYELVGKWETTMGAPEDLVFLDSLEWEFDGAFPSSEARPLCDENDGKKQLKKAEKKGAIARYIAFKTK